jgi:hypothetical protein
MACCLHFKHFQLDVMGENSTSTYNFLPLSYHVHHLMCTVEQLCADAFLEGSGETQTHVSGSARVPNCAKHIMWKNIHVVG